MTFNLFLLYFFIIFVVFILFVIFLFKYGGQRICCLIFIVLYASSFFIYYKIQGVFLHLVFFYLFSGGLSFLIILFCNSQKDWLLKFFNFLIFIINIIFGLSVLISFCIFLVLLDFGILKYLNLLNYHTWWLELIALVLFFKLFFLYSLWFAYDLYKLNILMLAFFLIYLGFFVHYDNFNFFFADIFYSEISTFCLFDFSNFNNIVFPIVESYNFNSLHWIVFRVIYFSFVLILVLINLFYLFYFFLSIFLYLYFLFVIVCLGKYVWWFILMLILGFLFLKKIFKGSFFP